MYYNRVLLAIFSSPRAQILNIYEWENTLIWTFELWVKNMFKNGMNDMQKLF